MKIILAVLLAVNVLMFYWISQSDTTEDVLKAEMATNMPPLHLLSEKPNLPVNKKLIQIDTAASVSTVSKSQDVTPPVKPKTPATPETLPPETPEASPPVTRRVQPSAAFIAPNCYSLGPFAANSSLESVTNKLRKLDIKIVKRYETRRELTGYWVYIPPLPSRADAGKVVSMLKERGVKDYLIIPSGGRKNAISLGVFGSKEGAEQHKTHMQTLGIAPVMEAMYKDSDGFWMDFTYSGELEQLNRLVNDLQNEYAGISMKKRQCLE